MLNDFRQRNSKVCWCWLACDCMSQLPVCSFRTRLVLMLTQNCFVCLMFYCLTVKLKVCKICLKSVCLKGTSKRMCRHKHELKALLSTHILSQVHSSTLSQSYLHTWYEFCLAVWFYPFQRALWNKLYSLRGCEEVRWLSVDWSN